MQVRTIQDLGQAVKLARGSLRLTQEAAAALCGVSMPFLNQLEGGKRLHLSFTKVLGVCEGLGVSLHALPAGHQLTHRDLKEHRIREDR